MSLTAKRWIASILCLILCIGTLPGIANAADVEYVVKEDYILNWGIRDQTATFLSPNAESFYEDNHVTYEDLAALSGSSDIAEVPESELYLALQELMMSNHTHQTKYDETRNLYRYTDCQNGDDSSISSFYSGVPIGPGWDSGATWNREHTWPNSKGLDGSDENDIMMLRPTAKSENGSRGNKAYGESTGYYHPNMESAGKHDLRGDVSRIMLYTYVRWDNTDQMWGSDGVVESKEVLLRWMREDPVDTWELGRNDSVESITGTRNVFVDYPELAFVMFGETIPANMVTPSGKANSAANFTIVTIVNDPSLGQITVDGRVITAEPAQGCRVAGYTVTSGEAIVTHKDNTFTVHPLSDCTVRIDFETIQLVTVSFLENGTAVGSQTVNIGDSVTLPPYSGTVPEGFSFLGWVVGEVSETSEIPTKIYPTGSSIQAEEGMIIHALYSRRDENATGTSNVFEPFSGELTSGNYLIVSENAAMKAEMLGKRIGYTDIRISDGNIDNPDEKLIWQIAPAGNGYYTLYNEATGLYAAGSGVKNNATLISAVSDAAKWSADVTGSQVDFKNLSHANKGINANLRRNSTYGFACYAQNYGSLPCLYKQVSGVVYYSTSAKVPEIVISPGDVDLNGKVDVDDVLALLWHVLFPEDYPIEVNADFDSNGTTDVDDVLTLLWHVLFPEDYPLVIFAINTPKDTEFYVGDTFILDYTYSGDKSALTVKSEDTTVFTVKNDGGKIVVTGVGDGRAFVRISCGDTKLGHVRLSVVNKPVETEPAPELGPAVRITKRSNNGPWNSGMVGNHMSFTAVTKTANDENRDIVAFSTNTDVATVSCVMGGGAATVKVTYHAVGSTTITIQSDDGEVSESFSIQVSDYVSRTVSTPEEYAAAATYVMTANGMTQAVTGSYTVLVLSPDELTWPRALGTGQEHARRSWVNGRTSGSVTYEGINEDGKYVFYIRN